MTKAYTIDDFCKVYSISKSFFYKLMKDGRAPQIMKVGKRTLVSSEAAETWRKSMEA